MSATGQALEEQVTELSSRVLTLELRLEQLTARFASGETSGVAPRIAGVNSPGEPLENQFPLGESSDISEEVLNWAGRAALLPRLSTLCFLLVVALILRTITDSGFVDKLIGSGLGMSYAAVLMVVGWHKYRGESPLAPVFVACGAILMSTIVVETHTHFKALPLVPAYLTLMATSIGMAFISRRFNTFLPISVGILCMCLAGIAIDYPHPFFPYLSMVLFTANVLGYFAARMKRCSWLRWIVLIVSMAMHLLWGFRIGSALRGGETPPPELAIAWFLPILSVFAVTFLLLALLGIVRCGTEKISLFDLALPTLSILWAFSAALYVVSAQGSTFVLGIIGTVTAIGHLAVTFWLVQRGTANAPGAGSFTFACGALLALALPAATGKFTLSLPVISMVAIFMAITSRVWGNGMIRVTTYVFHIYCCIALVFALQGDGPVATDAVNILPAGLLAFIILYQYQWCRRCPPEPGFSFFARFDHNDRSAVLLLLAGLVSGFYMIRIGIFQTLQLIPGGLQRDTFHCGQSVLINVAAIVLILFAYLRRDKEIRNVAILVTLVGGIKVFLYDLLGAHGLPLVFSVFTFGMAAAVESVALGKWMKVSDLPKNAQEL